jgi:hypothetical protein
MAILGIAFYAILIAGFGWAMIDLLVNIHKQPKRPLKVLRMSSYPFVPDDETLEAMRQEQSDPGSGKLQPIPVRVERDNS